MIITIGSIALGGALGALARHGVNVTATHIVGHGFPWGTLAANIMGSFFMGLLIASLAHFWQPSPAIKSMLVTGFLGAFTTFSTFSLDTVTLWERGALLQAGGYMAASVIFSITALIAGMLIVRSIAP